MSDSLYMGIDLGTSGCRGMVIDAEGQVIAEARAKLKAPLRDGAAVEQDPDLWWQVTEKVITRLASKIDDVDDLAAIAVDGTSGTLLVTDESGKPLTPGLMYNDARAVEQSLHIDTVAPAETAARGASSTLAKLLWLQDHGLPVNARHALHQADWIANRLCGRYGLSDVNNSLKLGFDAVAQAWPGWLDELGVQRHLLPQVLQPGDEMGTLNTEMAKRLGLPEGVRVRAGTTDSTAAILSSGAIEVGEAITSLGSTLVAKVIGERPIYNAEYGVYSQPLGNHWLVGGASNTGGAVLLDYFSEEEIDELSGQLQPEQPTGLDYYPLSSPGERFPVNDPELEPRLDPRPRNDALFLQGMLEGMSGIEKRAYDLLTELGAPYPQRDYSLGGGASNPAWTQMREERLGVKVKRAKQVQAAYGTVRLVAGLV
ncbi:MAG: FGGY-family carbohydrate kinase [Gammaproteobacteria bacterium]|nr:FGGY-family carbohydrate kinase [Gammaproteobacteria bacterium]